MIYFIATTNRTGGAWFCRMLRSTGVAGAVREPMRHGKRIDHPEWQERLSYDPCGVKVSPGSFRTLKQRTPANAIQAARFVWLRRRNTWGQAISQYRAKASGAWHTRSDVVVPFDREQITRYRNQFATANVWWAEYFDDHDIEPHELWYEDLCDDPAGRVRDVLEFLGLDTSAPINTGGLGVLRDATTEAWKRRLETFTGENHAID